MIVQCWQFSNFSPIFYLFCRFSTSFTLSYFPSIIHLPFPFSLFRFPFFFCFFSSLFINRALHFRDVRTYGIVSVLQCFFLFWSFRPYQAIPQCTYFWSSQYFIFFIAEIFSGVFSKLSSSMPILAPTPPVWECSLLAISTASTWFWLLKFYFNYFFDIFWLISFILCHYFHAINYYYFYF